MIENKKHQIKAAEIIRKIKLIMNNVKDKHYLRCEAPICNGDPKSDYKNRVLWCPGEIICKRTPYEKFQKKQKDINRWVEKGKFKNVNKYYTANDLENSSL